MSSMNGTGPRADRFHDENGEHRTAPPPGAGTQSWVRDMRAHLSEHRTNHWVFNTLVPQLEAEAEADTENVVRLPQPPPPPRRVRIGDVVYDVFPEADE